MQIPGSVIVIIPVLLANTCLEAVLPLKEQWRQACSGLISGRAATALQQFNEFASWYGNEPEVADPVFREGWIRLWALAAMQAGELGLAATLLERWMEENPAQERYRAFLRFQLAGIYRVLEDHEKAGMHRELFLTQYPDLPECALIRWNWADEAIARGDFSTATSQLGRVIETPELPESGRTLAQAAMAFVRLADGSKEAALLLLKEAPERGGRILRFWQALAAPALTGEFLAAGMPDKALEASEWLHDPASLVSELEGIAQALNRSSTKNGIRREIWANHWQSQLERLKWSLSREASGNALCDSLYPLRLRALIEAGQSLQAVILGQAVLRSPKSGSPGLRVESYKAIIEASLQVKAWSQAEAYAEEFLRNYPDDPSLPEILFLNARTAAAREDWPNAIGQVRMLMQSFPDHRSRQSWAMLLADWLLQSGAAEAALTTYRSLADEVNPSWLSYIRFQEGRCHEALSGWESAAEHYSLVESDKSAQGSLREFALLSLLKLHLKRMNAQAFDRALRKYRNEWPDGLHRGMVENIAGVFLQRTGKNQEAISIFRKVASLDIPEAGFAREQLSKLYRQINDMDALRGNAIDWTQKTLATGKQISPTPFLDLLAYQERTRKVAIPESLFHPLRETLNERTEALPAIPFLEVVRGQWPDYRNWTGHEDESAFAWVEKMAIASRNDSNWPAFAAFQFYLAHRLEMEGRHDSADARRIEVLQTTRGQPLGENTDFILSCTAHRYDFPEAAPLLAGFLSRYPQSPHQAEARLYAARRHYLNGEIEKAQILAGGIIRKWPDAEVFEETVIQLSSWLMDGNKHESASGYLTRLLERPGLPAETTARALLLRADCDFRSARRERGLLGCVRILSLYPDIHDIAGPAIDLLKRQLQELSHSGEREEWTRRLQQTLPKVMIAKLEPDES